MTKVKNETGGSRAIHALGGEVIFAAGEEKDVKFAPGGITAAKMIGLTVDGDEEDEGSAGAAIANGDAVKAAQSENDDLKAEIANLKKANGDAVKAEKKRADKAEADLAKANTDIEALTKQIEELTKPA